MLPRSPSSRRTARTPPFLRLKARCWDGSQAPAGSCQSWGVSFLSGASVAVSLKPKALHFRLRGGGEGVDGREHLRCRLNTDFDNLLEGIVGPQDLRDPSMSLGVMFHDLGAALEPNTPTGKRVDVAFDRGVMPEVLDGIWRREIGEPQFVAAKDSD